MKFLNMVILKLVWMTSKPIRFTKKIWPMHNEPIQPMRL